MSPKAMSFVGAFGVLAASIWITDGLRAGDVRGFDVFWLAFYVMVMAVSAEGWDD